MKSFGVSFISGIDKVYIRKCGGNTRFSVENFCLEVPRKLAGEAFCTVFQENSVSEKVYGYERGEY